MQITEESLLKLGWGLDNINTKEELLSLNNSEIFQYGILISLDEDITKIRKLMFNEIIGSIPQFEYNQIPDIIEKNRPDVDEMNTLELVNVIFNALPEGTSKELFLLVGFVCGESAKEVNSRDDEK